MKRPASVTAIGWFVLIGGVTSLAWIPVVYAIPELQRTLDELGWPLTEAALFAMAGVLYVACGLGMLKGLNWGRLLYLVYVPFSLLLFWLLRGFDPLWLPSIPLYVVILVFLTRPAAAAFFASEPSARPKLIAARPPVVIRRAASVILLAVGVSFVLSMLVAFVFLLSEGLFDNLTVIILVIPVAIGAAIISAGVALWGWNRWRIVFGVVLTVGGGFAALTAAAMPLMMSSPEWQAIEAPVEASMYRIMLGYALAALLLTAVGIPLIMAQRRRDLGATE